MKKFNFNGLGEYKSSCGITQYEGNIFVLSYTDADAGTSVTNGWAHISKEIEAQYNISIENCTLIEDIPHSKVRYSIVNINKNSPKWSYLSNDDFTALIAGKKIIDV